MNDLTKQKCVPCEGGTLPLTQQEYAPYFKEIDDKWEVIDDVKIRRQFVFKDFQEALLFVNKVGSIAEQEGHHPNICLFSFNKVKITLTTHAIGGLSINDFILAAKIDTTYE